MRLLIVLALALLLFGCAAEAEEKTPDAAPEIDEPAVDEPAIAEASEPPEPEMAYQEFSDDDFSVEYPGWAVSNYSEYSILALQKGPCILNVDRHNMSMSPLFNWMVNLTASDENVELLDIDVKEHSMTFRAPFQNITFKARYLFTYCNHETYIVGATCAEDYWDGEEAELERFLSSAACARIYEEPDYSAVGELPGLDDTTYTRFIEEDYSADMPDWDEADIDSEENVIAFIRGPCVVALNKYNALAEDLYGWIEDHVEGNGSIGLVHKDVPEKEITYDSPYGEMTMRANARVTYCNYQSYSLVSMCEKDYYLENSGVLERIVDSASCAREYTFTPEITDVDEPAPPEEERIVETDVGSEYGINAEAVVAFFNSNPVFVKVMRNYDKVNLRVIDEEEHVDIQLKARLEDGLITNVKEGRYSDADFTLIMPLDDALNIFNNADHITLANLLSFAVNVETDPPEMLGQLIKDAFRP